ncbi:MAG: hypothetical protein LQ342_003735 [Letrouitia transgressa]|nr:MAG: hypothetical protein LQ342_003735 [Letrouitia transgressa]
MRSPISARHIVGRQASKTTRLDTSIANRRSFHDYFVTHLPSSSLHPDSGSSRGPHHKLPRSASKPHDASSTGGPSPAPFPGANRDTTVVRIPIRSAKHHFGASVSRGQRPYNEDTFQAGVIELPAFAKRAPVNLTRAPASSPLQAYREEQRKKQEKQATGGADGEGKSAESASGDPQVFYFGVFDGHGGTECSGFLREKLHEFIEEAAERYGLKSSLSEAANKSGQVKKESQAALSVGEKSKVDTAAEAVIKKATPLLSSTASEEVSALQSSLMKTWRDTVGGYFRRFSPSAFSISPPTIATVVTHAFLTADLSFLTAQLRLSTTSSDPVLTDSPINASDIVPYGPYSSAQQSSRHSSPPSSSPKPFMGGSTCSLALISTPTPTPFWHPSTPATLLTAHCGDTRILLCRTADGAAVPLTTSHHPSSPSEAARLRRHAASFVTDSFGEERMSGLANTRSFGDITSKRVGVSAEPQIETTQLAAGQYAFMVLVSDGVSGEVGDQEIVDLVKEQRTPEEGAKSVVGYATEVGREGDNATCLVVRLGGWERREEGGGGSLGTREARKWRRTEAADPRRRRML